MNNKRNGRIKVTPNPMDAVINVHSYGRFNGLANERVAALANGHVNELRTSTSRRHGKPHALLNRCDNVDRIEMHQIPERVILPRNVPRINFKNYVDFEGCKFKFGIILPPKCKGIETRWNIGQTELSTQRHFEWTKEGQKQVINGILDMSMNGKTTVTIKYIDGYGHRQKSVVTSEVKVLPKQHVDKCSREYLGRIRESQSVMRVPQVSTPKPMPALTRSLSLLSFTPKNENYLQYKKHFELTKGFFVRCPRPAVPKHQLKRIPHSLESWPGDIYEYCSPARVPRRSISNVSDTLQREREFGSPIRRQAFSDTGCSRYINATSSSSGSVSPSTGSPEFQNANVLKEEIKFEKCLSYKYRPTSLNEENQDWSSAITTFKRDSSIPRNEKWHQQEVDEDGVCLTEDVRDCISEQAYSMYYCWLRAYHGLKTELNNVGEGLQRMNRENR